MCRWPLSPVLFLKYRVTKISQPNQFVEEAIARLGVVAMELSEHNQEAQRLFEMWNQVANILIFYSYLQLAPLGSVLERLREKVCDSEV